MENIDSAICRQHNDEWVEEKEGCLKPAQQSEILWEFIFRWWECWMGMEPFKTAGGYRGQKDEAKWCAHAKSLKKKKEQDARKEMETRDGKESIEVDLQLHVRVGFVNLDKNILRMHFLE